MSTEQKKKLIFLLNEFINEIKREDIQNPSFENVYEMLNAMKVRDSVKVSIKDKYQQ